MAKVLHGTTSNDQLNVSEDNAQAYGLKGNDTIVSDGKSDVLLVGGSGDDSLIVMGGQATLSGGEGSDVFELNYSADKKLSAVIEDLQPSEDKIVVNFDGSSTPQLTSVRSGNDVVWQDGDGLFTVTLKSVRDNDYFDDEASNEVWRVLELTNAEREAENLSPLTISDDLTAGASIRAQEITDLGKQGELDVYRHRRPNNEYFSTVLKKIYNNPVGENLEGGARSPKDVMEQWMSSESHKENILNSSYQKLGVGYNYDDEDPTDQRWYWVQLFANNLKYPESIGATNLSRANISRDAVSKFIAGTEGNDTIQNSDYGATIDALGGNDSITNAGLNVSISGGADNDTILSSGSFGTINAGTGSDQINLLDDAREILIQYNSGDGNDSISGFNDTSTLSLSGDEFTSATVGSDVVVSVGSDSITLLDAAKSFIKIHSPNSKIIMGSKNDDSIDNFDSKVTINGGAGDDSISNEGSSVSIDGGEGADDIFNFSSSVTINGSNGDDYVFNNSSSVSIDGGLGDDYIRNWDSFVSILGGEGKDSITNRGTDVIIEGKSGDDEISNYGKNVSIDAGDGNDNISNFSSSVTISGAGGNDSIYNHDTSFVIIDGGALNDSIDNRGSSVTINAGSDDDYIVNDGSQVSINAGSDDDFISNFASLVTINALDGNDFIFNNNGASSVTINGGADSDTIYNSYDNENVSINGGAGSDSIINVSSFGTIDAGAGNDTIFFSSNSQNNLVQYTAGDGINIIQGFKASDTVSISGSEYTPMTLGSDILLEVEDGYIFLSNAASLSSVNVDGEISKKSKLVPLSEEDDYYENTEYGVTIQALGGNDSIINENSFITINGGEGSDFINNYGSFVSIDGGAGTNVILNEDGANVSIDGGTGNNFIGNTGLNAVILGGEGNDTIGNWGSNTIIRAKAGNDQISFSGYSQNNIVLYEAGDGNDIIVGFNETDTLIFSEKEYAAATIDNNIIIEIGDGSISLWGAASLESVNIVTLSEENKHITLSEDNNFVENTIESATIEGIGNNNYAIINHGALVSILGGQDSDTIFNNGILVTIDGGDGSDDIADWSSSVTINGSGGNDNISVSGSSVSADGGSGDDYIHNWGTFVSILGGDGNDSITNNKDASSVDINGGAGDDSILNLSPLVTIAGAGGNDSIINNPEGSFVSIDGGAGDDFIRNFGSNTTILGSEGKTTINNGGSRVMILGGDDNNSIQNSGSEVIILGGNYNDSFYNEGSDIIIFGGAGNDSIRNDGGNNVSIIAGEGDDEIVLSNDSTNNFVQYNLGDGNDTIWVLSKDGVELNIPKNYSASAKGNDVIVKVEGSSILLKNARNKPLNIIIGESGTSGGSGNSGNSGGGGSSGTSGTSSGQGGNTSGGTSASANSNSDASGGQSASGSSGTSATSGGNGSSGRGNSSSSTTTTTAGSSIFEPITIPETLSTTSTTRRTTNYNPLNTSVTTTRGTYNGNIMSPIERIYSGGNKIIKHYGSWRKITFDEIYRGAHFDGTGNFIVESSSGHLVFENATDKVINLKDAAGNDFIKAHMSSTAGTVDGRIYSGYQILNGSLGEDLIFAGADGSQLWGNADNVSDTLVGGDGADIFISGKNEGSDTFQNASSADVVNLNDTSLSDIVSTNTRDGVLVISFNTGNTLTVQSTEALSANIIFSDGANRRFNHATNSWQTA